MTRHWEAAASVAGRPAGFLARHADALADWDDALQGRHSLSDALAHLLRSLGAECGLIARTTPDMARPQRIALHDDRRGEPVRPLVSCFAAGQFGPALAGAAPGSLWLGHAAASPQPALAEWQAARKMRGFATLVLVSDALSRDHIEMHFRTEVTAETQAALSSLLPALTRGWTQRLPGLISRAIALQRHRIEAAGQRPILCPTNPAQLSRAEFRVCLLLSRGLALDRVAAELRLTRSTIRAHLRSIHAKTGTGSLDALLSLLLAPDQSGERQSAARQSGDGRPPV